MKRIFFIFLTFSLLIIPCFGEKYLALTFDDGPSGKYTQRLLDGLSERDVKATFFLCGYRLEQYPELARRIMEDGHEIGLHGYSHDAMCKMSPENIHREIEKTKALLPELDIRLLRPPGGLCSDAVKICAKNEGLSLLFWSVDPKDWATHDGAAVADMVVKNAKDGDIILLHDMTDSSVKAALDIIDRLSEEYKFVTVSELAEIRGIPLVPGEKYSQFPSGNS